MDIHQNPRNYGNIVDICIYTCMMSCRSYIINSSSHRRYDPQAYTGNLPFATNPKGPKCRYVEY